MLRHVDVIEFVDSSRVSWYTVKQLDIDLKKKHFKKGDELSINNKNYFVVEDYGLLRIARMGRLNPFRSVIQQLSKTR
ncbi:hypothetical protein [Sporolactobacillus spathodeae]|uniref:Uncharacterized protein n=1 Tax=Sporolactobacillus spathodeae TaxID=1465502 RepID=A0ABS2Q9L6_9BACL|nr:hypothetical protein [Sporolactobacillus spathodeae]MBM7658423.1 hypothetical protein [Sporolactobacillus spathodeae]